MERERRSNMQAPGHTHAQTPDRSRSSATNSKEGWSSMDHKGQEECCKHECFDRHGNTTTVVVMQARQSHCIKIE